MGHTKAKRAPAEADARSQKIRSLWSLAAFGFNGLNGTNLRAELGAKRLILKIDIVGWFAGDRFEAEQLGEINLLKFWHVSSPVEAPASLTGAISCSCD